MRRLTPEAEALAPTPAAGPAPRNWAFEAFVVGAATSSDGKMFAVGLGDGTVRLIDANGGEPRTVEVHKGACLCLIADIDGKSFLSGGDDGRLVRVVSDGETEVLAELKGKWIEHVAANAASGFRAYAAGKDAYIIERKQKGEHRKVTHASTVGGLAINDKGRRLAVSHYNGVTLWWLAAKDSNGQLLEWKGSNLNLIWSPDGDYLISSLQDNALHGWRLSDKQQMNMSGYEAKVRSMSFDRKGQVLATSGSDQVICWPFTGGGPMGKAPIQFGGGAAGPGAGAMVTAVMCNPKHELIAAGFGNGAVIFGRSGSVRGAQVLPASGAPISALCWNPAGDMLLMGDEDGRVTLGDFRTSK